MSQTVISASSDSEPVTTYFASPERLAPEEIKKQNDEFMSQQMLVTAFDAVPITLVVLNEHRQVIGVNSLTRSIFGENIGKVFGQRTGEVFGCVHACEGPAGCGTGKACASCGAVKAIVECIETGEKTFGECCLESTGPDGNANCLELKVSVSQFPIENKNYYSMILEDNSQNKRIEVMQRLFFHDVLNTIGCIRGYVDIIQGNIVSPQIEVSAPSETTDNEDEMFDNLSRLCSQLQDEVLAHRQLISAESGDLVPQMEPVKTLSMLRILSIHYHAHELAQKYEITILPSCDTTINTDKLLLMRILGNMMKNAIEASPPGSTISLQCTQEADQVVFHVNNPGVISDSIRYQIFKRSFSTKIEAGHGLGTYSMRLFGEKYLGGKVDFTSDEETQTTFRLHLPVNQLKYTAERQ